MILDDLIGFNLCSLRSQERLACIDEFRSGIMVTNTTGWLQLLETTSSRDDIVIFADPEKKKDESDSNESNDPKGGSDNGVRKPQAISPVKKKRKANPQTEKVDSDYDNDDIDSDEIAKEVVPPKSISPSNAAMIWIAATTI